MQQAMALQQSRENLADGNAYKDLQKIKQLSYELNSLAEQFITTIETTNNNYQLKKTVVLIRDKGNELYFQAGYPFGKNALGVVQAAEAYMELKSNDDEEGVKLLAKLKESRNKFFAEYSKEIAGYQSSIIPGKTSNDIVTRQLMKFIDAKP